MGKVNNSKAMGILSSILAENAGTRVNGKRASERTMTAYGEVLKTCFRDLYRLEFRIDNPRNLKEIHVKALCELWVTQGKAPSTMRDYLSKLRVFAGWIGKDGMVKSLNDYLPDVPAEELKVTSIAERSKSWAGNDVDVIKKIKEADAVDQRFGAMLRLMLAFGLRRKEVIHLKPHKADYGDKLIVFPGEAKGGRPRDILIETDVQRQVLDHAKSMCRKAEGIAWSTTKRGKPASLDSNYLHYSYLMRCIGITKIDAGVTGHGLRAQFAENKALLYGLKPPTLGGVGGQKDKDEMYFLRSKISEMLGHSRIEITGHYYGSFGRNASQEEADRCKKIIESALPYVEEAYPSPDQLLDCLQLMLEMTILDVGITLKQTFILWREHSRRNGVEWMSPAKGNAESMEVAAQELLRRARRSSSS